MDNVRQNLLNCTIDKKTVEHALIPRSNTLSIIFYMNNTYFYNFWDKILAQYSPKRTKLHNLKKIGGSMPLNPSNKHVALPLVTYNASRHANIPRCILNFSKIF